MKLNPVYLIAGAAVAASLAYVAITGTKNAGQAIGGAAVDMVDGLIGGVVVGAGQVVGIPATNKTQCELDTAAGNTWAASFSCPAKKFLSYLWS